MNLIKPSFPFFRQSDAMDCGPNCLRMIAAYYGKSFALGHLRNLCVISRQGVTFAGLQDAAVHLGFKALPAELTFPVLRDKVTLPCMLHWEMHHYVVVYRITKEKVYVADPAIGKVMYSAKEFQQKWHGGEEGDAGRALLLEPTSVFFAQAAVPEPPVRLGTLLRYLHPHRRLLIRVALGLAAASLFTLVTPFLTQAVVDKGIPQKNISLLALLALAQCMLFAGRMVMDFVRARLLFRLGTGISIHILSEFLSKLMLLPLPFFDTRHIGDNIQRMMDHQKIEDFLTTSVINAVFAGISILIFGTVICYYSLPVFVLFFTGSTLGILWMLSLMDKRKMIDHRKFKQTAENQSVLIETISSMQEIKLTGSEMYKQEQWRLLQEKSYDLKLQSLKIDQRMQAGSQAFNEIKNILITYLAATQVVSGNMTLGMMLAVTYIVGQLNGPVLQLAEFIRISQNARFSLQRINEVHHEREEDEGLEHATPPARQQDIRVQDLCFQYGTRHSPFVLQNVSLTIPSGRITAIVGMSGSGKTTLLKLLLKFYRATSGKICIGDQDIAAMNARDWRAQCGAVMQEGFIFSDTIARNIAVGKKEIDIRQLQYAARTANIHDFIMELPFAYETVIGKDGHGLSEGQAQRILLARLIYRDPAYIFLDEATNSLDANNERAIMENLQGFFQGRTVVIVAHRLSTVKHADQIIVLDKGCVLECGDHAQLVRKRSAYYRLIQNQLELGK